MTRTIDFYFDFPSPYAYLAHTQLPRIASEHGATVAYHPFRILELMKIVGNRPTTIECKNKAQICGRGPAAVDQALQRRFCQKPALQVLRLRRTRPRRAGLHRGRPRRRVRDRGLHRDLGQARGPLAAYRIGRCLEESGLRRPAAPQARERRRHCRPTGSRNESGR